MEIRILLLWTFRRKVGDWIRNWLRIWICHLRWWRLGWKQDQQSLVGIKLEQSSCLENPSNFRKGNTLSRCLRCWRLLVKFYLNFNLLKILFFLKLLVMEDSMLVSREEACQTSSHWMKTMLKKLCKKYYFLIISDINFIFYFFSKIFNY